MPSTYTHYSLAKEIIPQLPKEIADICKKYENQYLLGAQGPDFFYFYRPIKQNEYIKIGKTIHEAKFRDFLKYTLPVLKEYGIDSMEYAYILGFVTHFTLDSVSHPYIIPQVKKKKFRHAAMETEFDRCLLLSQGENPHKYPMWNTISKDKETIQCVSHLFPDISSKVIGECIRTFYYYRRLYHTPNKFRYYLVKIWFWPRKRREYFGNLLFSYKERKKARKTNPELFIRYRYALKEAVKNIIIFHDDFIKNHPVNEVFYRNFK